MEKGLVSVIMPTYNCAKFIGETIESIQEQTYNNWELIIVDDCSTDNTKDVVDKFIKLDKRINYNCLKKNSGAAVARTTAMNLANGEYMAFCDSDDVWERDFLERAVGVLSIYKNKFSQSSNNFNLRYLKKSWL